LIFPIIFSYRSYHSSVYFVAIESIGPPSVWRYYRKKKEHEEENMKQRRYIIFYRMRLLLVLSLGLCVLSACTSESLGAGAGVGNAAVHAQGPQQCVQINPAQPGPSPTPTTLATLEQAYWCVFDHYVIGNTLDDRVLLDGAFSALVQELVRKGLDQSNAMLPALSGNRHADWRAFSTVYQQVSAVLPQNADLQHSLAVATMQGMVQSLQDNHTYWTIPPPDAVKRRFPTGALYGFGMITSVPAGPSSLLEAQPPLFIIGVQPGSPAAQQGLRPGDIITAVNGIVPFADNQLNPGVMAWLSPEPPQNEVVHVTLLRPAAGQTWTVDLTPAFFAPFASVVSARVIAGSLAYVRLTSFIPHAADMVFQAIAGLHLGKKLRGIILDLRSNMGGFPDVARLLGAFVHGKIWETDIDRDGKPIINRTDDTVPLLHQPPVVLIDRRCASACEAFAWSVRDLEIGKLVGTRTAGVVAGPSFPYLLTDGSILNITEQHSIAAKGEKVDGIGVAPDYTVPVTAQALSSGQDSAIEKAVSLLR
jgi:carboxyl-terminal processing protease